MIQMKFSFISIIYLFFQKIQKISTAFYIRIWDEFLQSKLKKNEYFYRVVKPPEVRMPFQIHRFHYLLSSQRTCSQSRKHIQWELPCTSHRDPSGIFIRNLKSGPLILICHVRNAEVVHVRECFLEKSSPLLRNPADLVLAVWSHNLELHLTGAGHGAPGPQHK